MKSDWPKEKLDRLMDLRRRGLTLMEMANALGLSYSAVQSKLNRLRLTALKKQGTPPSKWFPADDARLRELHDTGHSEREIAAIMGRTVGAARGRMDRMGLRGSGDGADAGYEREKLMRQNIKMLASLQQHHPERAIHVDK